MVKILNLVPGKIIEYSFYLLFLLVPLIMTPVNYELFEYNKMMLTYGLTTVIVGAWIIKIIINKRISIKRTPLDIPLILFLASQVISTIFSIDRHVSIFGYYSRFNGGLLSTISYLILYYAFVSNFPAGKIRKLIKVALFSGLLVSIYGVLEHFGIDRDIWVQDVQNRVFSTLGQPNWLAAYLSVLIPIAVGFAISNILSQKSSLSLRGVPIKSGRRGNLFKSLVEIASPSARNDKNWIGLLGYLFIGLLFYLTLIFTKSRSGFLGFWTADIIFWFLILIKFKKELIKAFVICNLSFVILTFIFGSPFDQINRFTWPVLISKQSNNQVIEPLNKPTGGSVIDVGITESGTIRRIVWKGATDIFLNNPVFGTGVETFAFAYYKYRPVEHNMTSEWDFLYNKAHNEYLNYAATTGAFGLGSYLLIILVFIGWNIKNIKYQISNIKNTNKKSKIEVYDSQLTTHNLQLALFASWLSILITNFFGFSVVIIQLFFFLIPAISFILTNESDNRQQTTNNKIANFQYVLLSLVLFVICYLLFMLGRLWYADVIFADGYRKTRANDVASSYQLLKRALEINDEEPLYYDEFSFPAAQLAVAFADEKQATLSGILTQEAIIASNLAVSRASQNVNFWKTRTRVFYALTALDEKYFTDALNSLEQAKILAPTDPKVRYNLGLLYDRIDQKDKAISELEETTKLKPDYRDAFYALAYLYEKDNKRDSAKEALQYILTKIATDDAEAKKKLEELK